MTDKLYVITRKIIAIILGNGSKIECRRCGVTFKVGDLVYSKKGRGCKHRLYHEECARGVNLL